MKKFFLFFISVLMCVGVMTSCSSDSDDLFDDDGEYTELTVGDGVSLIKSYPIACNDDYIRDSSPIDLITCYHSEKEWNAYVESAMYGRNFSEVANIDWDKQTLVFIEHHDSYGVSYGYCRVKKNGKKYIFDVGYKDWPTATLSAIGVIVVIDQPNVPISNFKLNAVDGFDIEAAEN